MRGIGSTAWMLVAASACRWRFAKQGIDGGGDDVDASGDLAELCTDHWCWERPPSPVERSMRAISGSSATNVWAVGDGGLMRRWDGTSWTVVESPTHDALTAVEVTGATEVRVAAGAGTIWHFNGSAWASSMLASQSTVAAFWRAPDGTLWAAGDVGTISIDGVAATGVPAGYAATGLDGTTTTNVWHTGTFNAVSRWNGSSWASTLISDFPTSVLAGASGAFVGGNNLWSCDMALTCTQLLANVFARDIFRISDTNMWAVGDSGHIEHFDGVSWVAATSPVTRNLTAVWGAAADDIWAVGEDGVILHYDGSSWTSVGNDQFIETGYNALWVGADDDRWLGGANAMWHSDGGTPVKVTLPAGTLVGDEIVGNAANDIYALDVGNRGVIHFDGTSWSLDPSLSTLSTTGGGLATSSTETLASGLDGRIYRKPVGGAFAQQYTDGITEWHGLCFEPSGDAIAVGRFGSGVIRTSGTWAVHDPPTGRFMVACSYAGSAGWGIGGDAVVKLAGTTWTALGTTTKTTVNLLDVLAVSDTEVYIVGGAGRIVRFNGSEWAEEASPVATGIGALSRSTSGTLFAVGHSPGMLRRR